jgi:hypothetical protein
MKYLNLPISKLFCFLLLITILQSCIDEKPGTWSNTQISSGKRDDFHKMNDEALQYLKADDMNKLGFMLSKELLADAYTNRTADLLSNQLKANDFVLLDEYYVVSDSTKGDSITISSPAGSKDAYHLKYSGSKEEKYIAFFVPKKGLSKSLISIIYNNYDYGWKIFSFDVAPYTINGKTAPQLFEIAKQQFANNHLVSALNTAQLATQCLRPAEIWVYPHEVEINNFYANLVNAANVKYSFPFVLTQIPTHPRIFSVMNQSNDDGSYPEIYYISSIKVADTTAIKKENAEIRKIIGTVMPGIDMDNKYILYSVSNAIPSTTENTPRFDMVDKLQ